MLRMVLTLVLALTAGAVAAQESERLEVNMDQWNNLADQQKQAIDQLLRESFPTAAFEIVAVPGGATAAAAPGSPMCRAFCDVSAALLKVGCGSIPGGVVVAQVCSAVADRAKEACYRRCQ